MPAEKGSAFLLKVGDGAATPVYSTVAVLRTTQLSINGETVVITNKGSGAWRELLAGGGVRSVSVAGAGVFTGSTAETRVKTNALAGLLDDYELSFESGDKLRGKFLVARLDYSGDFNGERTYTLALESSGQGGVAMNANPARGEAIVAGFALRPNFENLVAAEAETGPLFALVERAAAGELGLSEMVALFWHCRTDRSVERAAFGERIVAAGLAAATPALRTLLGQILSGR